MAVSSASRSGGDGGGRLCGTPGDPRSPWLGAAESAGGCVRGAVTAGVGLGDAAGEAGCSSGSSFLFVPS